MVSPSVLRHRILKQRGVELKRLSRKPVQFANLPTPYKKTRLMQLLEYRIGSRLEDFIFTGTIYEAEKTLGIDASTIYKWRTLIREARDKEFFDKFDPIKEPDPLQSGS